MPLNRYAKGRRLEYAAMKALEQRGFQCFRTAGSHSPVDIIAVAFPHILFIQCKAHRMGWRARMHLSEHLRLKGLAGYLTAHPLVLSSNYKQEIKAELNEED
jgi:Holliday junction resolvase